MLTCPQRFREFAATRASWRRSDWPGVPRVVVDDSAERAGEEWGSGGRSARIVRAYRAMMERALAEPGEEGDWILFTEDDLEVHPRIAGAVATWGALEREDCFLATLFNRMLRPVPPGQRWGAGCPLPERTMEVLPDSLLGAQALLVRRCGVRWALEAWDEAAGMQSQRLGAILGRRGPIFAHVPSLVQHAGAVSSWGRRAARALDFHPERDGEKWPKFATPE